MLVGDDARPHPGLFLLVVPGAEAVPVVQRCRPTLRPGDDVVDLPDARFAVRCPAGLVGEAEEVTETAREPPRSGLGRDELTVLAVLVERAQREEDVGVLGLHRAQHLLADVLVGHGAEPFDRGGVRMGGGEQRTVGEDHPDVDGREVAALAAVEQDVDEEIRHDLLVTAAIAAGPRPLRGDREGLADPGGVEPGEVGRQGRHPMASSPHGDAALATCFAMPRRRALGIERMQHPCRLIGPLPGGAVLEVRQVRGEDLVDLSTLLRRGGAHRPAHLMAGGRDGPAVGESSEHARHRGHQPPAGGHALSRGGGGPLQREGGLGTGDLPRLAGRLAPLEAVIHDRGLEADQGARLDRGHRASELPQLGEQGDRPLRGEPLEIGRALGSEPCERILRLPDVDVVDHELLDARGESHGARRGAGPTGRLVGLRALGGRSLRIE